MRLVVDISLFLLSELQEFYEINNHKNPAKKEWNAYDDVQPYSPADDRNCQKDFYFTENAAEMRKSGDYAADH